MRNLKNVSSCKLESIPNSIQNLSSLEYLDIGGNQLETLPRGMSELQSLKVVSIRTNAFRTIPKEILSLQNLRVLDIRGNAIEYLANNIEFLSLEMLYFDPIEYSQDWQRYKVYTNWEEANQEPNAVYNLDLSLQDRLMAKQLNFEQFTNLRSLNLHFCLMDSFPHQSLR